MPPELQGITEWAETISQRLPNLSWPEARGLALWSYGAQAVGSCGQSQVAFFLAQVLAHKVESVRQRLREWTWEAAAKAGRKRRSLDVAPCFGGLLAWVVALTAPGERQLALALDASSLGMHFVVLAVSVLYRGCAIPIAWQVLVAARPGAWQPVWLKLLRQLHGQVPADWCVLVLADRGLYAAWLFRAIQQLGWHPFLRINSGGQCRLHNRRQFRPLLARVRRDGRQWTGQVVCFPSTPVAATLLTCRARGCKTPWLLLTDLPPAQANSAWYALRAWIEAGFKDIKRGGWQWQQTRMTDPTRAARLWLVLAVTLLHALHYGSLVEQQTPAPSLADLPPTHIARRTATGQTRPRRLSLVRQGRLAWLAAQLRHAPPVALGSLPPNPWPTALKTYP